MMNAASPSPAASPPSGRSPALERRLRQRRADARVRLRLLSDCGLLAGHHASQPPRAASSATPVGEVAALRVLLGALALQLVEVRSEVAALRAASAPAEAATAPAPVDEAAAPAPVAEAATPAPVEEATSMDVEVEGGAPGQAAPAPVAEATAPAPVVVATAPAPLVEATTPAPAEEATAPAPVEEDLVNDVAESRKRERDSCGLDLDDRVSLANGTWKYACLQLAKREVGRRFIAPFLAMRSGCGDYHADVAKPAEDAYMAMGYSVRPIGGGRIKRDDALKTIHISGFSSGCGGVEGGPPGRGMRDHAEVAALVQRALPEYTVTHDCDGY